MSECCGSQRSTRFCPECGAVLHQSPGQTLLSHIRIHVSRYGKSIKKMESNVPREGWYPGQGPDEYKGHLAKWTGWEQWVRAKLVEEKP